MSTIDRIHRADPGDAPAADAVDDACSEIVTATQIATADLPGVTVDNECTSRIEGETVVFMLPAVSVRVTLADYSCAMARWAIEEWYAAASAALVQAQMNL